MGYQHERDEFIHRMAKEGMSLGVANKLLRYATRLHRLAEAQCNGDWPCDNGQREVAPCSKCEGLYVPSSLSKKGVCPDCRTEAAVREALPEGFVPEFHGDPRGAVLKLKVPSGNGNAFGGDGFVCVPTRRR